MSIGVDCEEIKRFERMLKDRPLLERMFSSKEIEYCLGKADPKKHLAARFCAKEAIIKGLAYHEINARIENIEIETDPYGIPRVKINIPASDDLIVQVSLSHCDTIAIGQAIVYDKNLLNDSGKKI